MVEYEQYITERPDFKVKVVINGCLSPADRKHVQLIREFYNDKGELTDASSHSHFFDIDELTKLYLALGEIADARPL